MRSQRAAVAPAVDDVGRSAAEARGACDRLQAFLQHAETSSEKKPTETALELGYFDQAHMSNEVARLAGASPGAISPQRVADFSKTRCG